MHRQDLSVRFYELDPYGHVNHSVYVQYFESARIEALASVGMGIDRLQNELGLTIVVMEIQTRFLSSALLADRLVIESGLSKVTRVKATWLQRILRGDELVATQRMTSGAISTEGKPVRWPDALVEAIERFRVDDDWL